MQQPEKAVRREAMERAKLAVRAYAREPSEKHARDVEEAWRRIRRFDAVDRWQEAGRGQTAALVLVE